MKKPRLDMLKNKYPLMLAFFGPLLGIFIVMICRGFIPFGSTSMLYSDMYHQYYPFFVAYRKALLSGDSLLYSWNVGMGMDYLGLISYYLASPLNLLSVLVPERFLLHYFSLLMPIKLSFASLFFAIFLKKIFRKNDLSIALFGAFYGLCAWALGYQWNIMWLDTFALLPLVTLGTISLLKDRKFILYTLTLFLSVYSNYYIGFFTCIFVLLVFVCYEICRWKGFVRFFCDLGIIALFSVLAIGMTAILTLPAYQALQTTQSSVNKFPTTFRLNIADEHTWKGLLDAMRQVAGNMNGCLEPTFKEGLPNLYCGICTNLFAFIYLTYKRVRIRDRICAVLLILFFNVSFIIRQLDYIWHGFHFTNMIPYRFSFLHSFVMLYMAYRAWMLRNRTRLWQVLVGAVLVLAIALCSEERSSLTYWAYNGVFLALYVGFAVYGCIYRIPRHYAPLHAKASALASIRNKRSLRSFGMLLVFVLELAMNLVNFGVSFTGTTVTDYPQGTDKTASIIRYMGEREDDTLFYRAETTHSQTLNDGALNGYNGISTFTSSANVNVTKFMKQLGYGAKDTYNRYCFEESSPISNLFLGLKYMLERQDKVEENPYFDKIHQYGKVHLLENNAYLPLGFLTENQILNVDFSSSDNTFVFQNKLFRSATGVTEDPWHMITGNNLSISGNSVNVTASGTTGYCSYSTEKDKGGTIIYKYVAPKDGLVCISLELPKRNKFSFWHNGVELYNETYSIPQSLSVCQVKKGEVVEVHLTCNANERSNMSLHAAVLDETVFREGYEILNTSTLELTHFSNTKVEGNIICNRDGILYTSIPQNGGWCAEVDGKPADIVLIGDAMVGLILPEGEHTISFTYHNAAFSLGWRISLCCFAVFVGLAIWIYLPQPQKKKS